jgi:internalin A
MMMKKLTVSPMLIMGCLYFNSAFAGNDIVDIPDARYQRCLNSALGHILDPDLPITSEELATLTNVKCESRSVTNISGSEYLTHLTEMFLTYNQIVDVTPLANLTWLNYLQIGSNNISDINSLSSLENIRFANFENNDIDNISAISKWNKLTSLSISNNPLSNLSPLNNHTNIISLSIGGAYLIDDLSPLGTLGSLTSLNMNSCCSKPIDFSLLASLKKLLSLEAKGNHIGDISFLKNYPDIQTLILDNNDINDLTVMKDIVAPIISLSLKSNSIVDLSPLDVLYHAKSVSLFANDQRVTLTPQVYSSEIRLLNPVIFLDGTRIAPSSISDGGIYDGQNIIWNNLPAGITSVSFEFSQDISPYNPFSGIVTLPLIAN